MACVGSVLIPYFSRSHDRSHADRLVLQNLILDECHPCVNICANAFSLRTVCLQREYHCNEGTSSPGRKPSAERMDTAQSLHSLFHCRCIATDDPRFRIACRNNSRPSRQAWRIDSCGLWPPGSIQRVWNWRGVAPHPATASLHFHYLAAVQGFGWKKLSSEYGRCW